MVQDPGNLESDLQAGARTGYTLAWVLMWSTVMVRFDGSSRICQKGLLQIMWHCLQCNSSRAGLMHQIPLFPAPTPCLPLLLCPCLNQSPFFPPFLLFPPPCTSFSCISCGVGTAQSGGSGAFRSTPTRGTPPQMYINMKMHSTAGAFTSLQDDGSFLAHAQACTMAGGMPPPISISQHESWVCQFGAAGPLMLDLVLAGLSAANAGHEAWSSNQHALGAALQVWSGSSVQ